MGTHNLVGDALQFGGPAPARGAAGEPSGEGGRGSGSPTEHPPTHPTPGRPRLRLERGCHLPIPAGRSRVCPGPAAPCPGLGPAPGGRGGAKRGGAWQGDLGLAVRGRGQAVRGGAGQRGGGAWQ